MQDIRQLAAVVAKHGSDPNIEMVAHAVLRSYGVDLLMSLAHAIQPSNAEELAVVNWLKQEIITIASQIPEAKGKSQ